MRENTSYCFSLWSRISRNFVKTGSLFDICFPHWPNLSLVASRRCCEDIDSSFEIQVAWETFNSVTYPLQSGCFPSPSSHRSDAWQCCAARIHVSEATLVVQISRAFIPVITGRSESSSLPLNPKLKVQEGVSRFPLQPWDPPHPFTLLRLMPCSLLDVLNIISSITSMLAKPVNNFFTSNPAFPHGGIWPFRSFRLIRTFPSADFSGRCILFFLPPFSPPVSVLFRLIPSAQPWRVGFPQGSGPGPPVFPPKLSLYVIFLYLWFQSLPLSTVQKSVYLRLLCRQRLISHVHILTCPDGTRDWPRPKLSSPTVSRWICLHSLSSFRN